MNTPDQCNSLAQVRAEIDRIECSDPGFCNPARHAPAHQLDFWGVGMFHAAKGVPDDFASKFVVGESLHWFEVNVDDGGEPGKGDDSGCPENGFGLHGGAAFVDCDCPDFYRITIHANTDPNSEVIYQVQGYFTGNFQIHPSNNGHPAVNMSLPSWVSLEP